ncbi:MAG TPA: DUF6249 domain-containing protein [Flavisolibacter sp.]
MNGVEMLIPILVPLGGFALIFGIVYLRSRENMAMIEKGLNPKDSRPAPFRSLKAGLLFVGAGLGLLLAYIIDMSLINNYVHSGENSVHYDEPAPLYFALIAIGGGLGLVISYNMEKKDWEKRNRGES